MRVLVCACVCVCVCFPVTAGARLAVPGLRSGAGGLPPGSPAGLPPHPGPGLELWTCAPEAAAQDARWEGVWL